MNVKQRESRVQRLLRPDEIRALRNALEGKMLIVKNKDCDRRHEAEQLESEQFVVFGRGFNANPVRRVRLLQFLLRLAAV
jgi:hypothetical protein